MTGWNQIFFKQTVINFIKPSLASWNLLSLCLSVCLSVCLSLSLSRSVSDSVCPLPVCLSVCLSSACLSVCLSVCRSVCLSVCLFSLFKFRDVYKVGWAREKSTDICTRTFFAMALYIVHLSVFGPQHHFP